MSERLNKTQEQKFTVLESEAQKWSVYAKRTVNENLQRLDEAIYTKRVSLEDHALEELVSGLYVEDNGKERTLTLYDRLPSRIFTRGNYPKESRIFWKIYHSMLEDNPDMYVVVTTVREIGKVNIKRLSIQGRNKTDLDILPNSDRLLRSSNPDLDYFLNTCTPFEDFDIANTLIRELIVQYTPNTPAC